MIKIKICYIQNEFKSIEVKGHANAAPYGQDIVCSGVSAVVFGGLANINCGKCGGIRDGEWHVDYLGQSLSQVCLT